MSDTGTASPPAPQPDPNNSNAPSFQVPPGIGTGYPPPGYGYSGNGYPPQQQPPNQGGGQPPDRFFTQEDVERIRREEKDKLYPELEKYKTQLTELQAREAERAQREEQERLQREEEARRLAEENMSARELIEARDREWEQKFAEMQAEQARKDAMYEQERRFQALQAYKAQVLGANANEILPELQDIDLLTGTTEDEINSQVAKLVAKSASVMQNVRSIGDEQRRGQPGVSPSAPSIGPMEMMGSQRNLSAEEIAAMPMADYAKLRQYLPTGASDRGDRGMWG